MTLVNADFDLTVDSTNAEPNDAANIVNAIDARYISRDQTPVDLMALQVRNIDTAYEAVGASQFAFDVLRVLATSCVIWF